MARVGRFASPSAAVGGLVLVALALRVRGMEQSLAGDELYSYLAARSPDIGELVAQVRETESTPPLFYLLAWALAKAVDPDLAIRLPSVAAGAISVPLLYLLGRRLGGQATGLIAAALMAVAPFAVYYSVEGRAYALATCLLLGSTFALLKALDSGSQRWWLIYVAAALAALYCHYVVVFALGAQAVWALAAGGGDRRPLLWAHAAIAAGYLPWLPFLRENELLAAIEIFNPLTLRNVGEGLAKLTGGIPDAALTAVPGTALAAALALATLIALAGAVGPLLERGREPGLLAALAVATPLGVVAYSLLDSGIYVPRNLLPSLPAVYLLLAFGAARLPRPLAVGIVIVLLAGLAGGTVRSLGEDRRRPPFDEAAAAIDERAGPRDPVVMTIGGAPANPVIERTFVLQLTTNFEHRHETLSATPEELAAAEPPADAERVFVVSLGSLPGRPLPTGLGDRFRVVQRQTFSGATAVTLTTYART